jgi:hypothetical protein
VGLQQAAEARGRHALAYRLCPAMASHDRAALVMYQQFWTDQRRRQRDVEDGLGASITVRSETVLDAAPVPASPAPAAGGDGSATTDTSLSATTSEACRNPIALEVVLAEPVVEPPKSRWVTKQMLCGVRGASLVACLMLLLLHFHQPGAAEDDLSPPSLTQLAQAAEVAFSDDADMPMWKASHDVAPTDHVSYNVSDGGRFYEREASRQPVLQIPYDVVAGKPKEGTVGQHRAGGGSVGDQ